MEVAKRWRRAGGRQPEAPRSVNAFCWPLCDPAPPGTGKTTLARIVAGATTENPSLADRDRRRYMGPDSAVARLGTNLQDTSRDGSLLPGQRQTAALEVGKPPGRREVRNAGPIRWLQSSSQLESESAASTIGHITLDAKPSGKRSAGKPHAAFEVAGAGNGLTVWLVRHSRRKRGVNG